MLTFLVKNGKMKLSGEFMSEKTRTGNRPPWSNLKASTMKSHDDKAKLKDLH